MPPGPAYNWLCVLYSTVAILSHAAQHRAAQIVQRSTSAPLYSRKRRRTGNATHTVQVQSQDAAAAQVVYTTSIVQDAAAAEVVYATSSVQNADIQTVYFNSTFNRTIH